MWRSREGRTRLPVAVLDEGVAAVLAAELQHQSELVYPAGCLEQRDQLVLMHVSGDLPHKQLAAPRRAWPLPACGTRTQRHSHLLQFSGKEKAAKESMNRRRFLRSLSPSDHQLRPQIEPGQRELIPGPGRPGLGSERLFSGSADLIVQYKLHVSTHIQLESVHKKIDDDDKYHCQLIFNFNKDLFSFSDRHYLNSTSCLLTEQSCAQSPDSLIPGFMFVKITNQRTEAFHTQTDDMKEERSVLLIWTVMSGCFGRWEVFCPCSLSGWRLVGGLSATEMNWTTCGCREMLTDDRSRFLFSCCFCFILSEQFLLRMFYTFTLVSHELEIRFHVILLYYNRFQLLYNRFKEPLICVRVVFNEPPH